MRQETVEVTCHGCGKKLRYPAAQAKQFTRSGKKLITFCGKRCQFQFISKDAERQMKENQEAKA